jgi:hypothetical protein
MLIHFSARMLAYPEITCQASLAARGGFIAKDTTHGLVHRFLRHPGAVAAVCLEVLSWTALVA